MKNKFDLNYSLTNSQMSPGYMIPGNDAGKKSYANKKETQKFCDRQNELSYHREIEYQITEGTLEDEERDYRER